MQIRKEITVSYDELVGLGEEYVRDLLPDQTVGHIPCHVVSDDFFFIRFCQRALHTDLIHDNSLWHTRRKFLPLTVFFT